MKATLLEKFAGLNIKHRKEDKFQRSVSAIRPFKKNETHAVAVVDARFYWTGSTCYCCVWISDWNGPRRNGSGKAGGYGYHKASAALDAALGAAGVKLSEPIGGRGDSAMDSAILAVAKAAGYPSSRLFRAHG